MILKVRVFESAQLKVWRKFETDITFAIFQRYYCPCRLKCLRFRLHRNWLWRWSVEAKVDGAAQAYRKPDGDQDQ